MKNLLSAVLLLSFLSTGKAQTLIINEVANGPSGTKEYVEYVVVDATVSYDCNGTPIAPCVDIQGWIIDDNSGWHGPVGVAGGALRFSFDPLWSCVPVGTIIVVYNDLDVDATVMPAPDLTLADGNCRLVVPVTSGFIEQNSTTPGDVACSYPATGWVPATQWSSHGLNNTNDCARMVDLAGCEVFSLCYGPGANLNTLIYFPNTGTDKVWYFNDGDPTIQANWTEGCCDPGACGSNDQTPGAPNNAANAAYIAQFNNGCAPITPISISATPTNGPCSCAGSATAAGSGNIAPYSYEWFDASMNPIGQTTATATGLCDGTYFVTVTSNSTGCSETTSISITNATGTPADIDPIADICGNDAAVTLTANPAGGTWSASCGGCINASTGEFDPSLASAGSNTITYSITGTCASTDTETANVVVLTITETISDESCIGACDGEISAAITGGSGTYDIELFDGAMASVNSFTGASGVTFSSLCPDTYTIVVTDNGSPACSYSEVYTIAASTSPGPDAGTNGAISFCTGDASADLFASLGGSPDAGGTWTPALASGTGVFDPSTDLAGTYTYTVSNPCGSATAEVAVNVTPDADATITPAGPFCNSDLSTTLLAADAGGTWSATCGACIDAVSGEFNPNVAGVGTHTVTYTIAGSCGDVQNTIIQVGSVTADFTANPTAGTAPLEVIFTNTSVGATSYAWNLGDGSSSSNTNEQNIYSAAGTYTVTLSATDGVCTDVHSITITVEGDLFIPNGFSPDGDGFNEVFEIRGILSYPGNTLKIYNRWGNEVYSAAPYLNDWDGTCNNTTLQFFGEKVVDGTYFYFLTLDDGREFNGFLVKKTK